MAISEQAIDAALKRGQDLAKSEHRARPAFTQCGDALAQRERPLCGKVDAGKCHVNRDSQVAETCRAPRARNRSGPAI